MIHTASSAVCRKKGAQVNVVTAHQLVDLLLSQACPRLSVHVRVQARMAGFVCQQLPERIRACTLRFAHLLLSGVDCDPSWYVNMAKRVCTMGA